MNSVRAGKTGEPFKRIETLLRNGMNSVLRHHCNREFGTAPSQQIAGSQRLPEGGQQSSNMPCSPTRHAPGAVGSRLFVVDVTSPNSGCKIPAAAETVHETSWECPSAFPLVSLLGTGRRWCVGGTPPSPQPSPGGRGRLDSSALLPRPMACYNPFLDHTPACNTPPK